MCIRDRYVAVQIFLHYSVFIKSLLYGKSMVMNNSRQSILPVLIDVYKRQVLLGLIKKDAE